jgi:hypothetical protein
VHLAEAYCGQRTGGEYHQEQEENSHTRAVSEPQLAIEHATG